MKPRFPACDEGRFKYSRGLDEDTSQNRSSLGVLLVMRVFRYGRDLDEDTTLNRSR